MSIQRHVLPLAAVTFCMLFALMPNVFAADPVMELPKLPTYKEAREYSNEIYQNKLLELYRYAIIYETQLKLSGVELSNSELVPIPTYDELKYSDDKVIKKYRDFVLKRYQQLNSLPEGVGAVKVKALQSELTNINKQQDSLSDENFRNGILANRVDFYRERYTTLAKEIDSLRYVIDKHADEQNQAIIGSYKILQKIDYNMYSVLSLSLGGTEYFFNDDRIDESLSPSVGLNFCPGKVFGMGRIISLWGDYSYLTNQVNNGEKDIKSHINAYSFGLKVNINFGDIFELADINPHLSLGYGYSYFDFKYPNTAYENFNSHANTILLEAGIENLIPSFPFEIYGNVNFSKFAKTVYLLGYGSNDIGKPWITNVSLGIRMPLWRKMKQLP